MFQRAQCLLLYGQEPSEEGMLRNDPSLASLGRYINSSEIFRDSTQGGSHLMIIFEQQVLLFSITMLHGTLYVLCSLDALLLNMLLLQHVDIICSGQLIYACRCLCNYYQQLHPS